MGDNREGFKEIKVGFVHMFVSWENTIFTEESQLHTLQARRKEPTFCLAYIHVTAVLDVIDHRL